MNISDRVQSIAESASIGLAARVKQLVAEGQNVIGMHVGEPDFPPPRAVIDATNSALLEGKAGYDLVSGIVALRDRLAQDYTSELNRPVLRENILVSNGSKQILYNIFQTLCNPGDEVIVLSPYWVTFPESIKLAGAIPVIVPVKSDLRPDPAAIEKSVTARTRAIIINSPNNPTGVVYERPILEKIVKLCHEKGLTLISDEAYCDLVYDEPFISPAALDPRGIEGTLCVRTFSKSHAMTGFRIGTLVGPRDFIKAMDKFQGHVNGNVCTFAQYGALKATELGLPENMIEVFKKRRDLAYSVFQKTLPCVRPNGAFYLFPNVESLLARSNFKSDHELAAYILDEAKVAILPGSAFGAPGHLRISFATSEALIKEAADRIALAFQKRGLL